MTQYRKGFNSALEGAQRMIELTKEIESLEHDCSERDYFESCDICEDNTQKEHEIELITDHWAYCWAVKFAANKE